MNISWSLGVSPIGQIVKLSLHLHEAAARQMSMRVTLMRRVQPQLEWTIAAVGLVDATNVSRPVLTAHALLLRNIGVALYGPTWRPEMARRRNVSSFVIRRWATGAETVPERVWVELREELRVHRLLLEDLLEQLPA